MLREQKAAHGGDAERGGGVFASGCAVMYESSFSNDGPQILSWRSALMPCANDQAYRFLPISRMNFPSGPNSNNCAAVSAKAGPTLEPPRENTKT